MCEQILANKRLLRIWSRTQTSQFEKGWHSLIFLPMSMRIRQSIWWSFAYWTRQTRQEMMSSQHLLHCPLLWACQASPFPLSQQCQQRRACLQQRSLAQLLLLCSCIVSQLQRRRESIILPSNMPHSSMRKRNRRENRACLQGMSQSSFEMSLMFISVPKQFKRKSRKETSIVRRWGMVHKGTFLSNTTVISVSHLSHLYTSIR